MATYFGKKILYRVCNFSYLTLCFVGLIWQVTQISINFFQFDVISDIRLSLPQRTEGKALNFCFQTFEMLKYEKYIGMNYEKHIGMNVIDQADEKGFKYNFVSNLTIRERFKLLLDPNIVFNHTDGPGSRSIGFNMTPFLIEVLSCYHMYSTEKSMSMLSPITPGITETYIASKYYMKNLTGLMVVVSNIDSLPWAEFSTVDVITDMKSDRGLIIFFLSSQSYFLKRLPSPYTDKCVDYKRYGYRNQHDAIRKCLNFEHVVRYEEASDAQIFLMNTSYQNYRIRSRKPEDIEIWMKCLKEIKNGDCEEELILTIIVRKVMPVPEMDGTHFSLSRSKSPSLRIQSKGRIDDIDFITYILGALGSWLGFSFLNLNPVPWIFKKNDTSSPGGEDEKQEKTEEIVSRKGMVILRNRIAALEQGHRAQAQKLLFLERQN